jgi:hypothetical protein
MGTIGQFIGVRVGQRLKFQAADGTTKTGVVERIDETRFPGSVFLLGDDGIRHEVQIHLGIPDDPE